MARVRDARTTRAVSHAEVEHQAGAGTGRAKGSSGLPKLQECHVVRTGGLRMGSASRTPTLIV
eukprot:3372980-Prymnesium_polylepis.1